MVRIVKTVSYLTYVAIVISSLSLHAAQPALAAAGAGSGASAQSMQLVVAPASNAPTQNLNPRLPRLPIADLKALLAAREKHLAELNKRLEKATKDTWNADKKAIQDAIEKHDVHPDDIEFPKRVYFLDPVTPLNRACNRFDASEASFIRFLLEKGAKPDYTGPQDKGTPAIAIAFTVDVARLLMHHGSIYAYNGLRNNAAFEPISSPELVQFYLDQGVVAQEATKPDSKGFDFLMFDLLKSCVSNGSYLCARERTEGEVEMLYRKVEIFLQAGAPLSTDVDLCREGDNHSTISACVKWRKDQYVEGKGVALLQSIEQTLKKHSDYRHDGIKEDLKLCKGTDGAMLLPQLQAMIIAYFIKPEPRYEQLLGS